MASSATLSNILCTLFSPDIQVGDRRCQFRFSERELTFTFGICYRLSVCLSVVCLQRSCTGAPYSGGCNFRLFFYGIWYLGHPL